MVAPPTTAPTGQSLVQAPVPRADDERRRQMKAAWDAYKGDFKPPLKIEQGQPDDSVIANRCAPIVDKGVSFLFGPVLKIQAEDAGGEDVPGEDDNGDSDPQQDYLDGVWGNDDDKMTLLAQLGTNGGVCGQPFLKLIPPQDEAQYPRLVVLDPQLVRPVTAPDDCQLVLAYLIEYPTVNDWQWKQVIARVDLNGVIDSPFAVPELNATWTITDYTRRGMQTGGSGAIDVPWQQVGSVEPWPYPFAPIFTCQNLPNPNEFWGRPDLTPDLINGNKVLNFIQSNIARIIKHHGHPITYAVNMRAEQISIAIDDVLCLPSPDSKLDKLDPMDNFSGLLAVVEDIRSNMDEQSRVPAVALGRLEQLPKGNISGVALQLLFQPLIEKTVQKRRLYGRLIRDVSKAALICGGVLGVERWEDYDVTLQWDSLLPNDDLQAAQTALILQQLGASSATLLKNLGLDPAKEAERKQTEDAQKVTNFSRGVGMPPQPGQQQPGESPFLGNQQQQGGQQ